MARKTSKRRRIDEEELEIQETGLHPEAKNGIIIVIFFAFAVLLFLSLFGAAGTLGGWIDLGLSFLFGWDRFLLPVLLIIIGATFLFPARGTFSVWNYLGMVLFFLSFNSLLNLILVNRPEPITTDLNLAGGFIGQILGTLLPAVIGYWGGIVTVIALLIVAVLLVFNTSLHNVLGVHRHAYGWMLTRIGRGEARVEDEDDDWVDEEEEEEDEEEEEEDDFEEEEEPELAPKKKERKTTQAPEKALLTKRRRRMNIPLDLLDHKTGKADSGDVEKNKETIQETFEQFGINVKLGETSTGPSVTQYTLRPPKGVKLARITGLQNDLALALAAHPIRIEAPIPGKPLVGIEVPNQNVATVGLREVLESKEFKKRKSNLSIPLGKDVSGKTWVMALDKMPHLLVAGATGSGKSVCINTVIVSLLYNNGPDDLKLILVDPKRVELNSYEGIPHLLIPPITKAEDAINALKWTVREMERRLDVLSKFGARDINSYNEKAEDKMPKIVFIIDELSDLMSVAGRDMEANIVRIAQMARAAGIHMVLATQRPSVDVITGLIKANVPGRIAFSVASQTDSRTILDISGAEKLLGRGDMLFSSAELSKPRRLQGAYLDEQEVERVVDFLKSKGTPDYNYTVTEGAGPNTSLGVATNDEPLIEEAIQIIISDGRASTSFLQRRLKIGYSRAARMMDMLEEMGVIGPSNGAKAREILMNESPLGSESSESGDYDEDGYDQDDVDEIEEEIDEEMENEEDEEEEGIMNDVHEEEEEEEEEEDEDEEVDEDEDEDETQEEDDNEDEYEDEEEDED